MIKSHLYMYVYRMARLQLAPFLFLLSLLHYVLSQQYDVCPASSKHTVRDCRTLNYYAQNNTYLRSDVSLLFWSGVHQLDFPFNVMLRQFGQFSMLRKNDASDVTVNISVSDSRDAFRFNCITFLKIEGISFIAYPNSSSTVQQFLLENVHTFECNNLNFTNLSVTHSYMYTDSFVCKVPEWTAPQQIMLSQSYFWSSNLSIDSEADHEPGLTVSLLETEIYTGSIKLTSNGTTTLTLFNSNITGSERLGLDMSVTVNEWESVMVNMTHVVIQNNTKGGISCNIKSTGTSVDPSLSGKITVFLEDTQLLDNGGVGMSLQVLADDSSTSREFQVRLNNCVAQGNHGRKGDGVSIVPYASLALEANNCSFVQNKQTGLVVQHTTPSPDHRSLNHTLNASIVKSNFTNNKFGLDFILSFKQAMISVKDSYIRNNSRSGLYVQISGELNLKCHDCTIAANKYIGMFVQSSSTMAVSIFQCLFVHNRKELGDFYSSGDQHAFITTASALMIQCAASEAPRTVAFQDSTFRDNADYNIVSETVHIIHCSLVDLLGENVFANNLGTPIQVDGSKIFVYGLLILQNNTAFKGGGISLTNLSTLTIGEQSMINISNNSVANTGGAIFYSSAAGSENAQCFYQIPNNYDNSVLIEFSNNTAAIGGQDIYGAGLNTTCYVNEQTRSQRVYKSVFKFSDQSISTVASDPTRVCLCNDKGVPVCNQSNFILSSIDHPLYPGEDVTISAVIVGADFGTVSGSVYSHLITDSNYTATMDLSQQSQRVDFKQCNQLEYTLYSPVIDNATLVLTITPAHIQSKVSKEYVDKLTKLYWKDEVSRELLLSIPVYIDLSFENCPLGFFLSTTQPYKCECDNRLSSSGINHCVIKNHTGQIYRSGDIWVGKIRNTSEVVVNFCPNGYCKTSNLSVVPSNPDNQCTLNRSGILCGKCPDNLSLALGSHRCIYCPDNRYVALIIPIVVGTLFLVFIIKILDLTVSKGTFNGLVFYVNVVWANESVFFSGIDTRNGLYQIAHTFLAWANLELGIETCFINHLDAVGKVWFHFGQDFLNIIGVTMLIFLTSRYSVLATKLFGNNTVQVLATIFFLSYTKLSQTIIDTLGFNYFNGAEIVWALDGNVPYFGLNHSFLLLVALASFLLLWLPYTVVLTFGQCLRKKSHLKPLNWVNKQKPYFDAYYGPFKDKYHYWFGTLLLARSVLLIVYAFTPSDTAQINLLAIVIVSGALLAHPYQYKNRLISVLEKAFLLNLIFLAAGVLLVHQQQGDKSPVVYISVGIALIALLMIIVFHVWSAIRNFILKKRSKSDVKRVVRSAYIDIDQLSQSTSSADNAINDFKPKSPNAYKYSELREPLLEEPET